MHTEKAISANYTTLESKSNMYAYVCYMFKSFGLIFTLNQLVFNKISGSEMETAAYKAAMSQCFVLV